MVAPGNGRAPGGWFGLAGYVVVGAAVWALAAWLLVVVWWKGGGDALDKAGDSPARD